MRRNWEEGFEEIFRPSGLCGIDIRDFLEFVIV
jgi:hypothetical protein